MLWHRQLDSADPVGLEPFLSWAVTMGPPSLAAEDPLGIGGLVEQFIEILSAD